MTDTGMSDADKAAQDEAERQRRLEEERLAAERAAAEDKARADKEAQRQQFESELVHFEFDKSTLTPEATEVLERKAGFMLAYPDITVVIEGHCDDRGTNEYNLALGDRRAASAKAFLVDMGVDAARMTTISYGEERPFNPGHTERAWAENRRVHFVKR